MCFGQVEIWLRTLAVMQIYTCTLYYTAQQDETKVLALKGFIAQVPISRIY